MRPNGLLKSLALMGALATGGFYNGSTLSAQSYTYGYDDQPTYPGQPAPNYGDQPEPYPNEYPPAPEAPAPAPNQGQVLPPDVEGGQVDPRTFEQDLSPYGRWADVGGYGRCWLPNGVAAGWRPYTLGYWTYTPYGWTWVSYEPFGWATYHYGRWVVAPGYGWVWVPGRVWGPAWVAWRYGGGYCGWAPLPPTPGFAVGVTVSSYAVERIPATWFSFVAESRICEPQVHRWFEPHERNVTIINHTTNITNITVVNKRVVNRGVPVDRIERDTGRRIERVNVREVSQAREAVRRTDDREARNGREVAIYRPKPVVRNVTSAGREASKTRAVVDRTSADRARVNAEKPIARARVNELQATMRANATLQSKNRAAQATPQAKAQARERQPVVSAPERTAARRPAASAEPMRRSTPAANAPTARRAPAGSAVERQRVAAVPRSEPQVSRPAARPAPVPARVAKPSAPAVQRSARPTPEVARSEVRRPTATAAPKSAPRVSEAPPANRGAQAKQATSGASRANADRAVADARARARNSRTN